MTSLSTLTMDVSMEPNLGKILKQSYDNLTIMTELKIILRQILGYFVN